MLSIKEYEKLLARQAWKRAAQVGDKEGMKNAKRDFEAAELLEE